MTVPFGEDNVTVKVASEVPLCPSVTETSPIESVGSTTAETAMGIAADVVEVVPSDTVNLAE